jgi:subtilisin family serine protease
MKNREAILISGQRVAVRRSLFVTAPVLIGLLFSIIFASSANAVIDRVPDRVPGEILLKIKGAPGVLGTSRTLDELVASGEATVLRRLSGSMSGVAVIRPGLRSANANNLNASADALLAKLALDPQIEYVQPNYIAYSQAAEGRDVEGVSVGCLLHPYDSLYCPQIFKSAKPVLKGRPQEVNPPVTDPSLKEVYSMRSAHAAEAWGVFRGAADMVVGVVDSGIDYNHEDLAFNMWHNPSPGPQLDIVGYDFLGQDGQPYDDDEMKGHGTHAAGIIGAVGGNGVGISGVNQRIALMALKAFSAYGYGTTESTVAAIGYAIDHGAKIVSNSWASGKKDNPAVLDVIEKARQKGVLLFFAAGNSANDDDRDETADYPAGYKIENLVAVASVDAEDQLASSSNYGATTVMVAAPGVNIYSTLPGSQYGWESGTSMACPFAAGAAALVWAKNPSWNFLQVKEALKASVDVLPQLSGKVISGGRVNVLRALQTTAP